MPTKRFLTSLKFIDRAAYWGAYIGAWAAMFLMALTFFDVWGRYLFSSPLPAVYEASETVLIPVLVYFSMARGNHITIDWVVGRLSGRPLFRVEMIRHLISIIFVLLLFAGSMMSARKAFEQDLQSEAIITFPIWPAYWVVAGGLGLLTLVRIVLLIKRIWGEGK
ncbi:MAG: TRAP transporter small permease [Deltaproteobacteria bacterium]|nr:TRAP transporter small permease [Deltaproteobacteria bacterium]